MTISAVVLAAGTSSRMGRCKQLVEYGGAPMVRIAAEAAFVPGIKEVLVVTGHMSLQVEKALFGLPVRIVHNPRYQEGQGVSLALGVSKARPDASGFALFLSDQPLITQSLTAHVVKAFSDLEPLALRPSYKGKPGHPVVISAKLRPRLQALEGDKGARSILSSLGDSLIYLPVDNPAAVTDVDTEEDLDRLLGTLHSPK